MMSSWTLQQAISEIRELKGKVRTLERRNQPSVLRVPKSGGAGGSAKGDGFVYWKQANSKANLGVPENVKTEDHDADVMVGFVNTGTIVREYWFPPWGVINDDWILVSRFT